MLRRWRGAETLSQGAKVGAVLVLLLALGSSLVQYATTDAVTLAAVIPVRAVVAAVQGALAGGAIGAILGRG